MMGLRISGTMLVGEQGNKIIGALPKDMDLSDFAEEKGMDIHPMYYDAPYEDCYFGFPIKDTEIDSINIVWVTNLILMGDKFYGLTGVKAKLIGAQSVM